MMGTLTKFQQFTLQIQHDPDLVRQASEFYKGIGIEKELREKCAKFIEEEEYWRNAAKMNPFQDTLYEDMKRTLRIEHEVFVCTNIDTCLKKRYPDNERLAAMLNECLLFERRMINQLNEELIPDAKQIDDIIRECGDKTLELKRQLQNLEMFGASQCDQSTLGNLVAAAMEICKQLVQGITIWKRVQQLQQYITEESPPNLNPLQKEFESFANLLLSLQRFDRCKVEAEIWNQLNDTWKYLLFHSLVFEEQPKQNLKLGARKQTKEFELKIRFLVGKTLLADKTPPDVELSFDCDHNFSTDPESKMKHKPGNIANKTCPLLCAEGRMDWSCTAVFSKLQVIGFYRCQGDKKSVWEQKYGVQATVTIPDGFGHGHQLQIRSLPIVVTTQTSQDWTAAAALLWDNAFADPDRSSFQVPERVPWSKVSRILSERFLKTVGRGLTMDHLTYLESKVLGPSCSSQEVSWSNFWKRAMDGLPFSFWKWFYAIHNLCVHHLKNAWALGLVEGFISKRDTKKKLQDLNLHSNNFILRFSDSKIEENESSTFGGSVVVVYNTVSDDGHLSVSFVEPYLASQLAKMSLFRYLSSMEEEVEGMQGKVNKIPLDYLCPNIPFDTAFAPLKEDEIAADTAQNENPLDDYSYKIVKFKHTVSTGNGRGHTPRSNSCAGSPAPSHYSYQDADSIMSPASSMEVMHSDPMSPASSFYSAVGSPQNNYGHAGLNDIPESQPSVIVQSIIPDLSQNLTLNEMNALDNSSGVSLPDLNELFHGDVEMPELSQILDQTSYQGFALDANAVMQ